MKKNSYFPALDGLRFFAAIFVSMFHLCYWSSFAGSTPGKFFHQVASYGETYFISRIGWVGVEIFFVLSGFVIANSALGEKPLHFLIKRALRLYPAIWICATITMMIIFINGNPINNSLMFSYLHTLILLPNDFGEFGWIDGVYWTLMFEVSFYLLVFISLFVSKLVTL